MRLVKLWWLPVMKTINNQEWGDVWTKDLQGYDPDAELDAINSENLSVRCQKIVRYLHKKIGEVDGKQTVEIGCGGAIYSRILARMGARPTLVDYSPDAIILAKRNLDMLGLRGELIEADIFDPPVDLIGKFDIAMSFGTVEHYKYPERLDICRAHIDLLKPGGICIISTPNILFLPHEILKSALIIKRKWFLGYEGSFSSVELRKVGHKLGLRDIQVIGSSWQADFMRYVRIVRETTPYRRLFNFVEKDTDSSTKLIPQKHHWLDDFLGHDIVLMGVKSD